MAYLTPHFLYATLRGTMKYPTKQVQKGFSLIEIMIVLLVIGILSTLALVGVGKLQASARDSQRIQFMTGIQGALERYYADAKNYPKFDDTVNVGGCAPLRVNSNSAFPTMIAQLHGRGYIDASQYVDPAKGQLFSNTYAGSCLELNYFDQVGNDWQTVSWTAASNPCGWASGTYYYVGFQNSAVPAGYAYMTSSTGQSYQLCLVKESGGTVVFKSPN